MLSMIAHCLVVLGYYYQCKNGATMTATTETVTTITKMVRGKMEEVLINEIMGQPTLNSI